MKRCIISYYPSTNKIHNIYNSVEDARKDVKMCNLFSKGHEKLSIAEAELTDEEYREHCGDQRISDEKTKSCVNCEDGCEEWAGCPCVYYKAESEDKE